jgi:hypothetical protein
MATKVASIFAEIGLDASKFTKGAGTVGGTLGDLIGKLGSLSPVVGAAGAALGAMAAYLQQAEKAAAESAQVDAKLEAILSATGSAAGMTSDELDNLAGSLSKTAGIDDELIKSAEGLMLTFRNVAGDAFPRAMAAAVDMQTTFGSLESATMQLGKALNDPVAGMGALSRAGITFSDTQKEQIKNFVAMNDVASAQAIILAEVEAQVGGTAAAINAAGDGSENLAIAWGNLSEVAGERLISPTRDFNQALTELIDTLSDGIGSSNQYAAAEKEVEEQLRKRPPMLKELLNAEQTLTEYKENSTNETLRAIEYGKAWEKALGNQTKALDDQGEQAVLTAEEIEKVNKTTTEYYEGQIGSIKQVYDAYYGMSEQMADLMNKQGEEQETIDKLIAQGWNPLSDKVMEHKDKLAEIALKVDETQQNYSEAMNQMVLDQIKLNLAVDGVFDETDFQKYLDVAESMGVMDAKSVELAKAQETLARMFTDGRIKTDELKAALDSLSSGTYPVDVIMNIATRGYAGTGAGMSYATSDLQYQQQGQNQTEHATGTDGAWLTVPPGYSNDNYSVGLTSGEQYSVKSQSDVATGGQSPAIDWRQVASIFSESVAYELDRRGIGV